MNNEQLLSDAQQRLKIIKFCVNLKHLLSRLTKTRKPKETHCQVSLDSVYKHYKTQRRFPPRIALHTYCNASNQLGMIIFAPVPLRCPTSYTSNGCRVLFGLERIKLSPPLLCVNLLLQTFSYLIHFRPRRRRSAKLRVSTAGAAGSRHREMASVRGHGAGIAGGESSRAGPARAQPGNLPRCDTAANPPVLRKRERRLRRCSRSQC